MKTKSYWSLLLAAMFIMFGMAACEKEDLEMEVAKDAGSEQNYIFKTQNTNGAPVAFGFWAGQTINVGNLLVSNDSENLYITFKTTGNWWLQLTHLHIATTVNGIPNNRKGTPVPGHFQYKTSHDPRVQTFTYTIPKTWAEGQNLVIAAHAEVVLLDANGKIIQSETGFGGDTRGPGNRWWFWAGYTVGSGSVGTNPGSGPGTNPPTDPGPGTNPPTDPGPGTDPPTDPGPGTDPPTGPGNGFVFTYCTNAWAVDSVGTSYINGVYVDGVFFRIVDATGLFTYPLIALDSQGKQVIVGQFTVNNITPLTDAYFEFKINTEYAMSELRLFVSTNLPAALNMNEFAEIILPVPQAEFKIFMNDARFSQVNFDLGLIYVAANAKFCPAATQRLSSR